VPARCEAHESQNAREDRSKAIAKAHAEMSNLTDAIASGALSSSPALAGRLQVAERELARLEADVPAPRAAAPYAIPRLASEYRAMVADLAKSLTAVSVPRVRAELRKLIGELRIEETEDRVEF
jgi:hypothetical protein